MYSFFHFFLISYISRRQLSPSRTATKVTISAPTKIVLSEWLFFVHIFTRPTRCIHQSHFTFFLSHLQRIVISHSILKRINCWRLSLDEAVACGRGGESGQKKRERKGGREREG